MSASISSGRTDATHRGNAMFPSLRRTPRKLVVDLWNVCNFACVHCSQDSGPSADTASLPLARFREVLASAYDAGIRGVTLLGGEPTVHGSLPLFLRAAREKMESVGLVSNGWAITPELAQSLEENGCTDVALSVYGHRPDLHDQVTRKPGSLARLCDSAGALRARGIAVRINVVVTALNVEALRTRAFWEFLSGLSPAWVRITNFIASGRGAANAVLGARPADYVRTLETLRRWSFPYRVSMSKFYYEPGAEGPYCADRLGDVPALMRDGELLPCCVLSSVEGVAGWRSGVFSDAETRAACPHITPARVDGFDIRCPMVEVEFRVGPALVVPAMS